jgi:hypothetical protein
MSQTKKYTTIIGYRLIPPDHIVGGNFCIEPFTWLDVLCWYKYQGDAFIIVDKTLYDAYNELHDIWEGIMYGMLDLYNQYRPQWISIHNV